MIDHLFVHNVFRIIPAISNWRTENSISAQGWYYEQGWYETQDHVPLHHVFFKVIEASVQGKLFYTPIAIYWRCQTICTQRMFCNIFQNIQVESYTLVMRLSVCPTAISKSKCRQRLPWEMSAQFVYNKRNMNVWWSYFTKVSSTIMHLAENYQIYLAIGILNCSYYLPQSQQLKHYKCQRDIDTRHCEVLIYQNC